jgi:two-component system NarL family sensor kinase
VGLSSALRANDLTSYGKATQQAIADIESEIKNLRAIISDLRPSLLDDLGLQTALEALVERRRAAGLAIEFEFTLPDTAEQPNDSRDLETAVYRLVQESLTNVVKHASASTVRVAVVDSGGQVILEVSDDGRGFDIEARYPGFGLAGMGERVFLLGGSLEIDSGPDGTLVRARIPTGLSQQATADADQLAS